MYDVNQGLKTQAQWTTTSSLRVLKTTRYRAMWLNVPLTGDFHDVNDPAFGWRERVQISWLAFSLDRGYFSNRLFSRNSGQWPFTEIIECAYPELVLVGVLSVNRVNCYHYDIHLRKLPFFFCPTCESVADRLMGYIKHTLGYYPLQHYAYHQ